MVRHHKPPINTAPTPHAAHLHPAARKRIGIEPEALDPGRALGRRRRQHQGALQQGGIDLGVAHPQGVRQCNTGSAVDLVERLHCTVHDDRPDAGVHPVQDALGLAKGVTEQHRCPALLGVGAPPAVDLGAQAGLRRPAVDRQAEGGFGDEGVAAHRLKRWAGTVRRGLVVARRHPDLAAVFKPHLRRAQHMPGRVQRDAYPVVVDGFAIGQRLQVDARAEPGSQSAGAVGLGQVVPTADACVVRMRVRDHRAINRPPGVNVEVARRAVQPFGPGDDEVVGTGRVHRGRLQHRPDDAARAAADARVHG